VVCTDLFQTIFSYEVEAIDQDLPLCTVQAANIEIICGRLLPLPLAQ